MKSVMAQVRHMLRQSGGEVMISPGVAIAGTTVDVTIHVKKGSTAQPAAVIDRELVRFLCLVRDSGSVQRACERMHCSTRKVQRMLRRFTEATGMELLRYHGWQGTELTPAGKQCIVLYAAALQSVQRIVRDQGLGNASSQLQATCENGRLKMEASQLRGRARDPTKQEANEQTIND